MGKGWSRGLTAATDARVARAAAAHRGTRYRPRLASDPAGVSWSSELAYAVGLVATDGCLVNTGRHIAFTSADAALVETFLGCIARTNHYQSIRTPSGGHVYRAQFGDVRLYRWLQSIGLTPRKSLTLGAILVPHAYLLDVARGLLDGDGSILHIWYDGTGKARGHRYETILTRFTSASRPHLEWLRVRLEVSVGVRGSLVQQPPRPGRHPFYHLTYAKRESLVLLARLYADPTAPRLERKWRIWERYRLLH